ncbi:hypothetical protein STAS_18170 [Striga asiatica]|uniref:RAB6-interacting golgin n=1 Tax=Striga asiatica TaxID=4170 RepID=A0A5A7Q866_STRAF|nr:hypothetical protein STAS_18170 [Striga asiatica]
MRFVFMATNLNLSPNNHASSLLLPEIGPDGLAQESPVIAYTVKIIEEEQLQLRKYIDENYSKIRDVERELVNLSMEMKLTAGPKKAALEHMRKKIEMSTERIRTAKLKEEQAKKNEFAKSVLQFVSVNAIMLLLESHFCSLGSYMRILLLNFHFMSAWEAAAKVVQDEEAAKQKLCEDLNKLVQESSNTQLSRLEELKRRLEALNPSRSSSSVSSVSSSENPIFQDKNVILMPAGTTQDPSTACTSQHSSGSTKTTSSGENTAINGQNPPSFNGGEGRGKKKSSTQGRIKGVGAVTKGRGPGWTGAGFDIDGRG